MGLFDGILKARKSAQERANDLQHQLQLARARRVAILEAPAAKSELKDIVRARVAALAASANQPVAAVLADLMSKPSSLGHPDAVRRIGILSAGKHAGSSATVEELDAVLALLFPQAATEALCRAVEGLAVEEGPTSDVRAAEIAKLDQDIQAFEEELAALYRDAEAAGLTLA